MTCPIKMPNQDELNTHHLYWLTDAATWEPTSSAVSESLDDTMPAPLGDFHDLGEMDLLDLNIYLSNLGGGHCS